MGCDRQTDRQGLGLVEGEGRVDGRTRTEKRHIVSCNKFPRPAESFWSSIYKVSCMHYATIAMCICELSQLW